MIVISDTGPLIALARIQQLGILKELYGQIYITSSTRTELLVKGKGNYGYEELRKADWIVVREIKDILAVRVLELELDSGEAETIILAKEVKADLVLMDESIGRAIAHALGIKVKGTVGLLLIAKQKGLMVTIKPLLNALREKNVWIGDDVYKEALRLAGEK